MVQWCCTKNKTIKNYYVLILLKFCFKFVIESTSTTCLFVYYIFDFWLTSWFLINVLPETEHLSISSKVSLVISFSAPGIRLLTLTIKIIKQLPYKLHTRAIHTKSNYNFSNNIIIFYSKYSCLTVLCVWNNSTNYWSLDCSTRHFPKVISIYLPCVICLILFGTKIRIWIMV